MKFPLNFHFGSMIINAHLVFEFLAYALGFRYYLYLRKGTKDKISSEDRMWIIIAGGVGAIFGSRIVGFFSIPFEIHSLNDFWIHWFNGKSILGGLLGGIVSVEAIKKMMGIKIYTGDLFVYPIMLGMMIGRLGCFSQGVYDGTHGNPSNLLWAMDMGDGIPRHPAQLYEILFLMMWWGVLKYLEPKLVEGARFKVFAAGYFFFRFFIEFIKPNYVYDFGLSAVQVASLVGLIYCSQMFINPRHLVKT